MKAKTIEKTEFYVTDLEKQIILNFRKADEVDRHGILFFAGLQKVAQKNKFKVIGKE